MNRTGQYLAEQRQARRLTPQQLAAAIGYRNLERGARRILALERRNAVIEGLLDRISHALSVDPAYVASLAAADRRGPRHAEAPRHRRRRSARAHHAPLRARQHAADVEPSRRRLGQAPRRYRRRHRAPRSAPPPRPHPQVRAAQLAHQNRDGLARRRIGGVESDEPVWAARHWPLFSRRPLAGFEVSTEELGDFDPQRIIRDVDCPGGCHTRLAITFEPLTVPRRTARCPACFASWPFRKNLERDGTRFEPVVRVDLGD